MTPAANPASPQAAKAPAKPPQLRLERTFDATPERLWTYWTDPKKYARWLSPQKADLVVHEWDLRVGGKVRFDMPLDNGQVNHEEGVFHVLDPPRRLVTGSADRSFVIEATFTPVDGGRRTRLTVAIDGVPPEWHAAATEGWGLGFGKLEALLAKEPSSASAAPSVPAPRKPHGRQARTSVKDGTLTMERWYSAPPERVFKAWSDRDMLPRFFWPVGTGRVDALDFRAGGRLVMGHTKFPDWTATWNYTEVVPGRKIVFTDRFPGTEVVATGTMEFIPQDGGTLLRSTFGPFPASGPYTVEGASMGFGMVADRVAEVVEVPGPGEGFTLVRHFQAPPQKVWEMWTTKEGLGKWWALSAKDMGYAFRVERLDVRVGGPYDIVMSNKEHGELHNHGVYTEVVPNRRLAYRWDFDIFLAAGEKPYPIQVSIDLEEVPALDPSGPKGTKMTFTQGPMAKPDFTEGSRQGVIANFAKLAQALDE